MNFTYRARSKKDGSIQSGVIPAADRGDALRQIQGMDLIPMDVTEGGTIPHGGRKGESGKRRAESGGRKAFFFAVALLIAVGVGVAVWQLWPKGEAPKMEDGALEVAAAPSVQKATTNTAPTVAPAPSAATNIEKKIVHTPIKPTGKKARVLDENGWYVDEKGVKHPDLSVRRPGVRIAKPDGSDAYKHRPELKTQTDKFLFNCIYNAMGSMRPRLAGSRKKLEEDFMEALKAPVQIMPDDTEEEKMAKRELEKVKKEILKQAEDNKDSIYEIMKDFEASYAGAAAELNQSRRELYRMVKEGKFEEADKFMAEKNEEFKKAGMIQLHVPDLLIDKGLESASKNGIPLPE